MNIFTSPFYQYVGLFLYEFQEQKFQTVHLQKKALRKNLTELIEINPDELIRLREKKFRKIGEVIETKA